MIKCEFFEKQVKVLFYAKPIQMQITYKKKID